MQDPDDFWENFFKTDNEPEQSAAPAPEKTENVPWPEETESAPQAQPEADASPLVDVFEADEATRVMDTGSLRAVFGEEQQSEQPPAPVKPSADAGAEVDIEERDYRPIRFRRDGRFGCLGGFMYAVFVISVSIILACFGWMAASDVLALNKGDVTITVTLPEEIFTTSTVETENDDGSVTTSTVKSADMSYVTSALKDSGIIEYSWLFKFYASLSNAAEKLDAGTYELSTRYDYRALVKNMQVGTESMVETTLMFPEGWTMAQIFESLEENGVCSAESLYEAAANYNYSYTFLEDVETGDALRLEGFIFPNTYDFYQGEQASSVINKFLQALHYRITADMWTQCENLGITFREAVTIASMIEKEAANDDERAIIASVIYNRLNAGMALCIDSTVLYDYPDYDGGTVTSEMMTYDSPYNTYLYTGLPPTPICNPGMASIQAALQPADTNYYYYALDTETGAHRFFTTSAEHAAFVATQNYG